MVRRSCLIFLSLLFLFNLITVGIYADTTTVSGFALLNASREKGESDSFTLGQFRVIAEKQLHGLCEHMSVVAAVIPNGSPHIHHLNVQMKDVFPFVDKLVIGQYSPPFLTEAGGRPDKIEMINYPSYTRLIVAKDIGVHAETTLCGIKLWTAAYGGNTRVGGLPDEQDSGRWHLYQCMLVPLPGPFSIGEHTAGVIWMNESGPPRCYGPLIGPR